MIKIIFIVVIVLILLSYLYKKVIEKQNKDMLKGSYLKIKKAFFILLEVELYKSKKYPKLEVSPLSGAIANNVFAHDPINDEFAKYFESNRSIIDAETKIALKNSELLQTARIGLAAEMMFAVLFFKDISNERGKNVLNNATRLGIAIPDAEELGSISIRGNREHIFNIVNFAVTINKKAMSEYEKNKILFDS